MPNSLEILNYFQLLSLLSFSVKNFSQTSTERPEIETHSDKTVPYRPVQTDSIYRQKGFSQTDRQSHTYRYNKFLLTEKQT